MPANSSSISAVALDAAVDWTSCEFVQGTFTTLKSRSTSLNLIVVVEVMAAVQPLSVVAKVDVTSVLSSAMQMVAAGCGVSRFVASVLGDGSHVCICQSNTDASSSGVTFCGVRGVSGVIGHGGAQSW